MDNVPFSVYDALGYLSAGAILLVASAIAVVGEVPTEQTLATVIGIGVASYIIGHIISTVSAWSLDRVLFNQTWGMGRPEQVLFGEKVNSFPWKAVFRRYHQPLPESIRRRVLERAKSEGVEDSALLAHCEAVVQRHDSFGPRIDRFEVLTIFLRNSSTAFAMAAVVLALAPPENAVELETAREGTVSLAPDLMALLSLLASIVLFFRYVKLAAEWRGRVFVLYAEAD
jgi:hypothetical protein